MNLKTAVKVSNIVAIISIVLLIYWVFAFIIIEVFGLKIFRENISQSFAMSVLGLMALMGGSLMINVMFNLTRIAQKHNQDPQTEKVRTSYKWVLAVILSFPLIFGLLFAGDYMTSKKKEQMLIGSALSIVQTNPQKTDQMVNYQFGNEWLINTRDTLEFFEKTERNFPHASVIVKDNVEGADVFLAFREYSESFDDNKVLIEPNKSSFLLRTTLAEREYFNKVFDEGYTEKRFSASDGNYQLYYPYSKNGTTIVLYFSDFQRYGKMGS